MRITITVKPNARKEQVEKLGKSDYRVSVNAPPVDGKANEAVIRVLARHFKICKSAISILRGQKGRKKLVEIRDGN